ncbi:hypothetical protein M0R88_13105 [Halorussus gelatinilyticus]|uniref:DUF7978 domain-containing protein n=1 Tax=Halorussus gelatinilyticus TaxID=2937524 RepID=A0A8U0IFD2_9EURY|nr:hypothetical protein [Halorussus gelatinilyticus]UPV99454.1 hypothetical protein M0R88_13105 [Halorussus gelatinilyticus]
MRTALRRIAAGALAYVVSYVLTGLVTVPRLGRYLVQGSYSAAILDVYHSAGSPLWQAVGWFTLNAHGISVDVAAVRNTGNFVYEGALWLGILPGWLGLVPVVACLLVGVAVTARGRSSPVPVSVGAYMVPGYLFAVLLSSVAFAGALGPVAASASIAPLRQYLGGRWLLLVVLAPLVFGSLGALLGQSPVLTATIERLRSGPSLR